MNRVDRTGHHTHTYTIVHPMIRLSLIPLGEPHDIELTLPVLVFLMSYQKKVLPRACPSHSARSSHHSACPNWGALVLSLAFPCNTSLASPAAISRHTVLVRLMYNFWSVRISFNAGAPSASRETLCDRRGPSTWRVSVLPQVS